MEVGAVEGGFGEFGGGVITFEEDGVVGGIGGDAETVEDNAVDEGVETVRYKGYV